MLVSLCCTGWSDQARSRAAIQHLGLELVSCGSKYSVYMASMTETMAFLWGGITLRVQLVTNCGVLDTPPPEH